MTTVAGLLNRLFDLLCAPFGGSAAWAVAALSVLLAAVMLLLFRWATDQDALVAARRRVTGRVYEMGLFQDHLGVLARIQRDLAAANLRYLGRSLPALLAMLVPLLLILGQVDARYGPRPLAPGETTLVTVRLDPDRTALLDELALEAPAGVAVETRPVRDRRAATATWRVRVTAPGDHALTVRLPGGRTVTQALPAGGGAPRLARVREREGLARLFTNPGEAPLPGGQPVAAVAVDLPDRTLRYGPLGVGWLTALCVWSILAGLLLKGPLGVRF